MSLSLHLMELEIKTLRQMIDVDMTAELLHCFPNTFASNNLLTKAAGTFPGGLCILVSLLFCSVPALMLAPPKGLNFG